MTTITVDTIPRPSKPEVGDVIGSNLRPLQVYLRKKYIDTGIFPKRLPRKLKKRIKKSKLGIQFRVVNITKSVGAHTLTLEPI